MAALYDPEARIAGLAHPLLPEPPGPRASRDQSLPLRYVATAIPALLGCMEEAGAEPGRIYARLAGGARMFSSLLSSNGAPLGDRNLEASRAVLSATGIPIRAEAVGGARGRSLRFRADDGELRVTAIGMPDVVL